MPPKPNFVIVKKTPAEIAAAQEQREREMKEKAEKNRLAEVGVKPSIDRHYLKT